VAASAIINEFALECDFHRVKDYFKDRINYDITTVAELMDVNQAMFAPVENFVEMFAEGSELMKTVLLEYGENYCTIFRNLTRLLRMELVDDVSKQADLDVHAAAVAAQFQQMGTKGLMFKRKTPPLFKDSTIVVDAKFCDVINQWLTENERCKKPMTNLLYRGSVHSNHASNFHAHCDDKGPTITLVRCTGGYIFGGFTPEPWKSRNGYARADNSFLFSLVNPRGAPPQKFDVPPGNGNAVYDSSGYGPTFGSGHDLHIANGWNGSYTNLGSAYANPTGLGANTFTGSRQFTPAEVEVWQVVG
jgi:hypothetical protein